MPTNPDPAPATAEDCLLVLTTFPDPDTARRIATALVESQLAACVNLLSPAESIYTWQGKLETAAEIPAFIKTTQRALPMLEEKLRELHPYEVPELIAVPLAGGSEPYLEWVRQNVSPG